MRSQNQNVKMRRGRLDLQNGRIQHEKTTCLILEKESWTIGGLDHETGRAALRAFRARVDASDALLRGVRGLGLAKLAKFGQIFANFWRARSRLYQNEILQENMRLTAFFKLYKICILLHRRNLKILAKYRFEKSAIFVKIQQTFRKCCKNCKMLPNFKKNQLDNQVDFEECCKARIYLQRSAPIQPKTSKSCRNLPKNSADPWAWGQQVPRPRSRLTLGEHGGHALPAIFAFFLCARL